MNNNSMINLLTYVSKNADRLSDVMNYQWNADSKTYQLRFWLWDTYYYVTYTKVLSFCALVNYGMSSMRNSIDHTCVTADFISKTEAKAILRLTKRINKSCCHNGCRYYENDYNEPTEVFNTYVDEQLRKHV